MKNGASFTMKFFLRQDFCSRKELIIFITQLPSALKIITLLTVHNRQW